MELIEKLVSQLGISTDQAEGGLGLVMKLVKEKLGDVDFGQFAEWIPGLDDIVNKAPEVDGGAADADGGGLLGKVASAVGGLMGGDDGKEGGGGLGALAGLAGGFSSLGIDFGKITDFLSTILDFVKEKGGDEAKGLLEKVLK